MIIDSEFLQGMNDLGMIFSTPSCSALPYSKLSIPSAPTTLNLPRTSPLILCYEHDATFNWPKVHELAGKILIRILNNKYNRDIAYTYQIVNTTALGYFNALKAQVDSGACDIAIASTNFDSIRLPLVHFNCPYGTSSPGFLRSALDNGTVIINSESDIDNYNVTVLTYKGSSYDNYVKAKYKKATLNSIASGYTEIFEKILKKEAHIVVADATDLAAFLKSNKDACGPSCFSKIFGDPFAFGPFITNNIRESSAWSVSNSFVYQILTLTLLVLFSIL